MKHLYSYIIEPINGRYSNEKVLNNKKLILNTKMDDHNFVNRIGRVIETPVNDPGVFEKGDEVVVHHNVFRRFYSMSGAEKNSSSYFEEDKYFCYLDQIFLYKRNNEWVPPKGYCFVKPVQKKIGSIISNEKEEPLMGVIKYANKDLNNVGIFDGDLVGFTPNSEYEFVVNKERLYRVQTNSVSIKYKENKEYLEYNPNWAI
jgi:hypothetical protein